MNQKPLKKVNFKIHGMHCANCEVLIERKFKKFPGIEKVNVSYVNGKAEIYCSQEPELHELQNAIKPDGYGISLWPNRNTATELPYKNTGKDL